MRPQDLYPGIGQLTTGVRDHADQLALLRVTCETWDPETLRVDTGSPWGTEETVAAAVADLAAAEEALRSATGRLEGAWAALGRLSSE